MSYDTKYAYQVAAELEHQFCGKTNIYFCIINYTHLKIISGVTTKSNLVENSGNDNPNTMGDNKWPFSYTT